MRANHGTWLLFLAMISLVVLFGLNMYARVAGHYEANHLWRSTSSYEDDGYYDDVFRVAPEISKRTPTESLDPKPQNRTIRVVGPREWTINNFAAQYSSRLIVKKSQLTFEAIVFYDNLEQTIEKAADSLDFLIQFDNSSQNRMFLPVTNAYRLITIIPYNGVVRYLFKIRSEVTLDAEFMSKLDVRDIVFLVTERNEYQRLSLTHPTDVLEPLLTFQKPFIYSAEQKKKPALAHCVHNVRNLDARRMLEFKNWLVIQQRLGYDAIKLYFLEVKEDQQKEVNQFLSKKNWTMNIEIIDYR